MRVCDATHQVLHRDPHGYCAHPHLVRCGGELVAVFNWAPRRDSVLHPPQDPLYLNLLTRSADEGLTWSAPVPVPGYGWNGVECAGLTDLGSGRLMLNQWRFGWLPLPAAERLADKAGWAFPDELAAGLAASRELDSGPAIAADPARAMSWARGPGRSVVHLSPDAGVTWPETAVIATGPFVGGYGMRGAVRLPGGALLLPLGDVPAYERVFVVRSDDEGRGWSPPVTVAAVTGRLFEEPAPVLLPSGRVLMLLRENVSRTLFQTHSDDGGGTWSAPAPTGIAGYPAHLTLLGDGRLLCTYGVRRPPFTVEAVLSEDDGRTWLADRPLAIRTGLPSKDLGYPCTLPLTDGGLLTVYYARDAPEGATSIQLTRWRLVG